MSTMNGIMPENPLQNAFVSLEAWLAASVYVTYRNESLNWMKMTKKVRPQVSRIPCLQWLRLVTILSES